MSGRIRIMAAPVVLTTLAIKVPKASIAVLTMGEPRQRERAPGEGELAVMAMPKSREQQRSRGDGEEDADERQRPKPTQRRAVEGRGCLGGAGGEDGDDRENEEHRAALSALRGARVHTVPPRPHLTEIRRSAQCASSQLWAARASTASGTERESAGIGACAITFSMTGNVFSTSASTTSNTSSSWTCSSICAESFAFASAGSMRTMARRMMSAAVPCSRALMAARSLKARIVGFGLAISG